MVTSDAVPRLEPRMPFMTRDMKDSQEEVRHALSALPELGVRVRAYKVPDKAGPFLELYMQLKEGTA